jgi:hypothetical protein
MPKKSKWAEVDRQWVATRPEADDIVRALAKTAASRGCRIGITPDDGGFLVTVEAQEDV